MSSFSLTILGTNAANPAFGRITSAQVLQHHNSSVLIDCGEATQIRFQEYKVKTGKIEAICISHAHGDHVFGLPGLLSSLSHAGRKPDLTLIGPAEIHEFVKSTIETCSMRMTYSINHIVADHEKEIKPMFQTKSGLLISAFPMKHRMRTYGYRFDETHKERNLRKELIGKYGLTVDEILALKAGNDVKRENGDILDVKSFTHPITEPKSYAYCSDTIYDEELIAYIQGVTMLYHETTYTDDMRVQAKERMHTTALQAAELAEKSKVGALITGHYSSRYRTVDPVFEEAKSRFKNTLKGYDGLMVEI